MIRAALGLIALLPGAHLAAQTVKPMTKLSLRAQQPPISDAKLKDQLWSVMLPEDRRKKARPHVVLSDVWMNSRPYATRLSGLCRTDTLILRFAPVSADSTPDATTPAKAYGFDSVAHYHFLQPPNEISDDMEDDGQVAIRGETGASISIRIKPIGSPLPMIGPRTTLIGLSSMPSPR